MPCRDVSKDVFQTAAGPKIVSKSGRDQVSPPLPGSANLPRYVMAEHLVRLTLNPHTVFFSERTGQYDKFIGRNTSIQKCPLVMAVGPAVRSSHRLPARQGAPLPRLPFPFGPGPHSFAAGSSRRGLDTEEETARGTGYAEAPHTRLRSTILKL